MKLIHKQLRWEQCTVDKFGVFNCIQVAFVHSYAACLNNITFIELFTVHIISCK